MAKGLERKGGAEEETASYYGLFHEVAIVIEDSGSQASLQKHEQKLVYHVSLGLEYAGLP